jgi:putative flippase GtrA
MSRAQILQFIKFLAVGVLNTLITLVVIALCKSVLHLNPYVSNLIGYIAGLINSFIWNKTWVFRSSGKVTREALSFILGWGICYALQLLVLWLLNTHTAIGTLMFDTPQIALHNATLLPTITVTGYAIATIIGMVVYTLANFFYNRTFAFKAQR